MLRACVDESGYTGRDLLSSQQPFMALSALFIDDDDALAIRERYFPRVRSEELKHKSLVRQRKHWDSLLRAQRECLNKFKGISFIANKRYLCIRKLLDDCIEPAWHSQGIDFYQNGHAESLASVLYFAGPVLLGRETFDRLLILYQAAARSKLIGDIDALSACAKELVHRELGEVFLPIADRDTNFVREIQHPKTTTNVVSSMLFGLVTQLEICAGRPYSVVHDSSDGMHEFHPQLEKLVKATERVHFNISEVAQLSFPLHLQHVEEADSKNVIGLQFADLLAGGMIESVRALTGQCDREYGRQVIDLYSDDNLMSLLPFFDQEEVRRMFRDNESARMIDFVTRLQ